MTRKTTGDKGRDKVVVKQDLASERGGEGEKRREGGREEEMGWRER